LGKTNKEKEIAMLAQIQRSYDTLMRDAGGQLSFAKELLKQMVFNPKATAAGASQTFARYSKEQIITWLQSPAANEKNLRNASVYMYLSSMHYQRLISYYAGLLMWFFVISPVHFEGKPDAESFRKQFYKTANLLETMNIPETMRTILTVILREGVYYGVRWTDKSSSFVQRINPDICKITYISDGVFLFAVDMSKIPEEKLQYYPEAFKSMFNAFKKDGVKFQEVPSEISVCLKADASVIDYSIPPFAAVMPALYKISDAEGRSDVSADLRNYKMIAGQVPIDSDGNPKIEYDIVKKYWDHLANSVGSRVGVAVTPFKLDAFNFEKSGSTAEIDEISRSIGHYWTTAGTSGLLHGIANDTAGVTKLAIKNDESYITGIMRQAERLINRHLKTELSGKLQFKITFLPITIFNHEEYIKIYKEAASFGIGKSYYMAAVGIPQSDIGGLNFIENEILNLDTDLVPLANTYNTGAESGVGRPAKDEKNLSPAGESTRDNDTNANR